MKKILVIEDDEILSPTLIDNLTEAGFEAVPAKDGLEGLTLALKMKPDLILLDIFLPKINGITMLKKLRQDPWGKNVPIIILSNLSAPIEIAEAMGGGVEDYMVKVDWKIEDVIKRIREKLKINLKL